MTDDAPAIPSFAATFAHSLAQKAGTAAATALLAHGLISTGNSGKASELISGAILMAGSLAWTWVRDRIDHDRSLALAAAPPTPSAAVQPAQPTKEKTPMNAFEQWVADLAAKAETALAALSAFNQAHPEVASAEAAALNAGVTDLASVAKSAVAADLPAPLQPTADDILAAIDAKAESEIAAIQSNAAAAKTAVKAALPAAA